MIWAKPSWYAEESNQTVSKQTTPLEAYLGVFCFHMFFLSEKFGSAAINVCCVYFLAVIPKIITFFQGYM